MILIAFWGKLKDVVQDFTFVKVIWIVKLIIVFFNSLHDRKLYILGICTLFDMGPQRPNIDELVPKILPSCLVLFDGLKQAYEAKAEADEDSSSEEDEEEDEGGIKIFTCLIKLFHIQELLIIKHKFLLSAEVLSSDEDDIEEMNNEYLENLARMAVKNSAEQNVNLIAKLEEIESEDVSKEIL